MTRRNSGLFAIVLLCGCSTTYRTEIQPRDAATTSDSIKSALPLFWAANGFRPSWNRGCVGARRDVARKGVACWKRSYPGWLFPYSGHLFGDEVLEGGAHVIYICSNGRENEAAQVAVNLRLFLHTRHADVETVQTETHYVDWR